MYRGSKRAGQSGRLEFHEEHAADEVKLGKAISDGDYVGVASRLEVMIPFPQGGEKGAEHVARET